MFMAAFVSLSLLLELIFGPGNRVVVRFLKNEMGQSGESMEKQSLDKNWGYEKEKAEEKNYL